MSATDRMSETEMATAIAECLSPLPAMAENNLGHVMRSHRLAQNAELVKSLLDRLGISLEEAADVITSPQECDLAEHPFP